MNRTGVINGLVKKYNYTSYLEIGVKNPKNNFDVILIEDKDGVDPEWRRPPVSGNKFVMTSDDFFNQIGKDKRYDLVFIDGLHHFEQIDKDIVNSLKHLNDNGTVVIHDCNPTIVSMQSRPRIAGRWTGDGWKSVFKLRYFRNDLSIFVVNVDFGCGVIRRGKQELYKTDVDIEECLKWKYFNRNRKEILNLIGVEEYKKWIEN
ncbi:hypothetical protein LCGC14_0530330 [marine sediment metagenome]|uniref:Class I SAM-dependent methyltransferase n=1 Tax=marine sediment metagenome TaxID=412755 RepID=A0A0F9V3X5_9ZZZZ